MVRLDEWMENKTLEKKTSQERSGNSFRLKGMTLTIQLLTTPDLKPNEAPLKLAG